MLRTERVADPETHREGMPTAESIPARRSCEVHPGADPVKYYSSGIRGYTLHTARVKDWILLIEWNRGYDFVSCQRRSLFVSGKAFGFQ